MSFDEVAGKRNGVTALFVGGNLELFFDRGHILAGDHLDYKALLFKFFSVSKTTAAVRRFVENCFNGRSGVEKKSKVG